jgi:hypothetical protein
MVAGMGQSKRLSDLNYIPDDFDFAFAGQEVFILVFAFDTIALYCLQLPF